MGWLRTLERVTRPPRLPFADLDTPLAEAEESREAWEPGELRYKPMTIDDVVAQLCQLTYLTEDLRNLISSSVGLTTTADDAGPSEVDGIPPVRPSEGPSLAVWLEPAVMTVLNAHRFWWANHSSIGSNAHCGCGERPIDMSDWEEHVAAEMGRHIAQALPDFPGELPGR